MEGKPLAKGISRQLTFTASDPVLINEMNVREFLLFDAAVRGIKLDFREVQTVMNRFGCIGFSEQKLKTCSLGMRKRVALAAAWSGSPHLVLLDESTNGLDTEAIFLLKDAISKTLSEGGTVILSAHILSFLQDVCTRVIMLDEPETGLDFAASALLSNFLIESASCGKTVIISSHSAGVILDLCADVIVLKKGMVTSTCSLKKEMDGKTLEESFRFVRSLVIGK